MNGFLPNKVSALGVDENVRIALNVPLNQDTYTTLLNYFVRNSTFRVLTYSSISCITFVAQLAPGVQSPFTNTRQDSFNVAVRQLLFKFFITNEDTVRLESGIDVSMNRVYRPDHDGNVEVATRLGFREEIRKQIDIYDKSYRDINNQMSPICPSILMAQRNIPVEGINEIGTRITLEHEQRVFLDFCTQAIGQGFTVSCIMMEMIEGYQTYASYMSELRARQELYSRSRHVFNTYRQRIHMVSTFFLYELDRLHQLGYIHGDPHGGNVLINPNVHYYYSESTHPETLYQGHLMLLDFGRTVHADTLIRNYNSHNAAHLVEAMRLDLEIVGIDFGNPEDRENLVRIRNDINQHRYDNSVRLITQLGIIENNRTAIELFNGAKQNLQAYYDTSILPKLNLLGNKSRRTKTRKTKTKKSKKRYHRR